MFLTISDKTNKLKPRWLLAMAIIFFILLASASAALIVFDSQFKDKVYPQVFIGNFNLGGKTASAVKQLVNQEADKINQRGLIFSYKNLAVRVTPVVASADGELAYQLISFNADQAAAAALNYGRSHNFFSNLQDKWRALTGKKSLALAILINREEVIKILKNNFAGAYESAQDARLAIKPIPLTNDYEFIVVKEKFGKTIDYEAAVDRLIANLANLDSTAIKLSTITQSPRVLVKDSLNVESQARKLLALAPLILKYGEDKWVIESGPLAQFLNLKLNNSGGQPIRPDSNNQPPNKVIVGLDDLKFKTYLTEQVSSKIDKKPVEAKFEISNGRVTEFKNGQDGLALNSSASFREIEKQLAAGHSQIELAVDTQSVLTKAGDLNSFGIKEIVGIGTSDFAGSPANRRHNIKIGADSVNGTLVKPGEEFSLLKVLGEVNGSTGYLPELVIKEGKTMPEFGGGLCQVGTTMFRAVIASGLPVTMRRNHSYRVGYYEPAGTDATIYNPWPDFRFINDLGSHILIQAKIASNTLAFEFWGTRDGRLAETTKPTIYNIVKPESTKIIETLELKPGEKKCTEHAHNGADAYFDYKVTYAAGEVREKRFSSHYVPWREVCLLGVEKLSVPPGGAPSAPPPLIDLGTGGANAAASATPAN